MEQIHSCHWYNEFAPCPTAYAKLGSTIGEHVNFHVAGLFMLSIEVDMLNTIERYIAN